MIRVMRGCLGLLMAFLMALPVGAQSWDTLRGLKAGERIRVVPGDEVFHGAVRDHVQLHALLHQSGLGGVDRETLVERMVEVGP